MAPRPKTPAKAIGKPVRPLQLQGPDDPMDPYIVSQAKTLGNDPQQIFNYLRDNVGYEAYAGSLRGARGTLWSHAGNAIDRASLMVALLEASGFTAQYVQGTLTKAQAQPLVLSMFQGRYRFIGCLPAGSMTADPGNDSTLLGIAEKHYWVEYASSANGPFTDADPSFPGSQLGQTYGTKLFTSTYVPGTQASISFEVDAEMYSQASAAFAGNGISTTQVLYQSYFASQLVGKPVSIGQIVSSGGVSGLAFSENTNTYTPYLLIGEDPANPANDDDITGTPIQEILTNFPLGSTVLTGLFAHITVIDGSGNSTTYDKTLFDRIGFAARNGGNVQVSVTPSLAPALSSVDFATFNVLPSRQDQSIITTWSNLSDSLTTQLKNITAQLPSDPNAALTPAQTALQQQAGRITNELAVNTERSLTASFAYLSDLSSFALANEAVVEEYPNSPRLIVSTSFAQANSSGGETLKIGFDLLKDDVQVLLPPGQNNPAAAGYRIDRGLLESYLEGQVFSQLKASQPSAANASIYVPGSATDILAAAKQQGIGLVVLTASNLSTLNALNISAEAQARITQSVEAGSIVEVPSQAVTIGGTPQIGWLEFQPDGTAQGVLENGDHGIFEDAIFRGAVANIQDGGLKVFGTYFVGFIAGFIVGITIDLAVLLFFYAPIACPTGPFTLACYKYSFTFQQAAAILLADYLTGLALAVGTQFCTAAFGYVIGSFCVGGFILGLAAATNLLTLGSLIAKGAFPADPPLPPSLMTGTIPPVPAPGTSPGVTVSLAPDTIFSLPLGNAPLATQDVQLPTVFDALITNTGPAADTFNLALLNPPAGFTLVGSLPTIQIPAGAQGQVTVCAVPTGNLPAPGTNAAFGLGVTSTTNSSITSSAMANFTVPAVSGATLTAVPGSATTIAQTAVTVALQIQGTGNVATSVALAATTDNNLTMTGLQSPVQVNPGQTVTQTLTITPASGAPLNAALNVTITGTFGSSPSQQTTTVTIPVTLQAQQALTAAAGTPAAGAAGRTDIAATLSGLSGAITALVAGCTPATLLTFQNYVQNLGRQLTASSGFFNSIFTGLTNNPFGEVQTATCSTYSQALTDLNALIANVNNLFNSPAAYPFQLALTPTAVLAQPNSTSTFKIQLQNQSQVSQTYNLSVSGIPPGLGGLNVNSVTLAAQQSVPVGNASDPAVIISQTGSTLQAFSFTVTATPSTLPTAAQSANATVTLRSDVLAVQDVKAQPGFVSAGGSVDIVAHIINTVNQPTPVQASLQVLDPSNKLVASAGPVSTTLGVTDVLTTFDFGQITIPTGSSNGNYTLAVTVSDAKGNPLQGGTGKGFLLVGSPVNATLTVTPQTVPASPSTVLNTLTVTPTGGNPNTLQLLGSVATASSAQTVTLNGSTAYVCDQNELSVVDVSNPAAPSVITTALSSYITNASNIHCSIQQGDLVIFSDTNNTQVGNNPGFLVFGLSNPQSPNLLNAIPFNKRFVGDPIIYLNNVGYLFTNVSFSFFGFRDGQGGDIISVDLSNIANPAVLGTLSQNGDPVYGGPSGFFGGALYNPQILFAASTTLSGGNFTGGSGALDVINITDPKNISLSSQTLVSGSGIQFVAAPLIQGNLLVALGETGSSSSQFTTVLDDKASVLIFDISNPQNPNLLSVTPANTWCCAGGGQAVLGPNLFLFSGTMDANTNGKPVLLLVDTTNPANPVITPLSVPIALNSVTVQGNYLYGPTASGLSIYSVPGNKLSSVITGYTATVQTSNSGTVAYDPSSFNLAPSKITAGSGFDTLEWDNPSVSTLTWNSKVKGLQPAQLATVDQGGTVAFTSTLGNGTVDLSPVEINADQIISLTPSTQKLGGNNSYFGFPPGAQYTAILRNPTSSSVTYNLSLAGIPPSWIPHFNNYPVLPATATVPALGSVSLPFDVVPPTYVPSGTYQFQVIANAQTIYGAVEGTLAFTQDFPQQPPAAGPGSPVNAATSNVLVQATPSTVNAGPGASGLFQVQLTNVGPISDSFRASLTSSGNSTVFFSGQFPSAFTITPGRTVTGSIAFTVPANAPVGVYPVTINAYGNLSGTGSAQAYVNVAANGVSLSLAPSNVAPPATTQVAVTNTGSVSDTFALSLSGPGATVATLASSSVTLAAGASQMVSIAVQNPTFATEGNLAFIVTGASQANPAVVANTTGSIFVPFNSSVTAVFQPASQPVSSKGTVVFPLVVQNTGSFEDGYSATVTGTTGGVQASLAGLDGTAVQTIGDFEVPAQAAAQLTLNATSSQAGTVTVSIVSLSDPTVNATAIATLTGSTVITATAPNASALTGATVPVHRLALLNASASADTNTPALPLTFAWTLTSAPSGSALTTASIAFSSSSLASFRPDVTGTYVFTVTVSNGQVSAQANATYQAADLPPVAITSTSLNVPTGAFAFLDGSNSYDPDGQPISFAWTLLAAPAGSTIINAGINNSQTPKPFFTPDIAGAYKLQLIVSDATAPSTALIATVTAASNGNLPPNADAGRDQNAAISQQVTLNGGASSDPNTPALALTYQWSFVTLPANSALLNSAIVNATSALAKFTPDVAGDYVLNLVVSNSKGSSQPASTTVHAFSGNIPPNADAGANQFTTPTSTVTLNSTASSDPDNGPLALAYLWWLNSLPPSSSATMVHPLTATPQFVADKSGYYIARVEATDGLASGFAHTTVTSANVCDADASGVINQTDIALIQAAIGMTVSAGDPRDFNHDLQVTAADVTGCMALIAPAVLQVSPLSFTVNVNTGSAAVQQSIQISSSGNALTFTVSSNQPWLTVNTSSGSTASVSTLNAQINPVGLGAGTYSGILTFTPGSGVVQIVMVTLNVSTPTVTPPPSPIFAAYPSSLQLTAATCSTTASSQTFTLTSTAGNFQYTAVSSAPWLSVSPPQGVSSNGTAVLTASVNPSGLVAGSYSGLLSISGPGIVTLNYGVSLMVAASNSLAAGPSILNFTAVTGSVAPSQNLAVSSACGSLPFTAQTDQPWLTISPASGATPLSIAVTASAASLGAGTGTAHVIITSAAAANSPVSIPVTFLVTSAPPPTYTAVNGASFVPGPLAPGTLFSIFGPNLASAPVTAQQLPLPMQLGGVIVTIGSTPIPLFYVGPGQINAQLPYGITGPVQLVVTVNGLTITTIAVQTAVAAPGLFIIADGSGHAAVENQDYSVNSPQKPASPGGLLQAFFTGQGALNPPVATGTGAPAGMPFALIAAPFLATIGGVSAQVLYAGAAPGFAALAQMDVVVPKLAPGDYALILTVNGQSTNSGLVSVGP